MANTTYGSIKLATAEDVGAVLKKKMGTQTGYKPKEWADTINLLGLLPIRTASGTIAHFEDGADSVPMKSVVANIVPIQEGSGTPSPSNPRPISGTDELTLKHDNENMLVMSTFDFTIQGVRVYTNEDGNVVLNGTSTQGISSDSALWANNLRFSLPKGHYYLSCNSFSTYGAVVVVKNTDTNATICQFNSNWQIDLTETTPMRIGIYIPADKTFDNFVCNFEASLDNITYDVPNRKTYTIALGQTVYGGSADVVGGTGEETYGYIASYNGEEINEPWLSSIDPYVQGTTPSTGAEVVYPLTTPTNFTFTGQEINSLEGVNNIYVDSGEVLDVEYRADMNLLISELGG